MTENIIESRDSFEKLVALTIAVIIGYIVIGIFFWKQLLMVIGLMVFIVLCSFISKAFEK